MCFWFQCSLYLWTKFAAVWKVHIYGLYVLCTSNAATLKFFAWDSLALTLVLGKSVSQRISGNTWDLVTLLQEEEH